MARMNDVAIVELTERPALAVRSSCSFSELGDTIGPAMVTVFDHLSASGLAPAGPPYVRYHSFSPEHIELETGFPVPEGASGAGEIEPTTLPAGEAVLLVHVGPYEELPGAHEKIQRFIADHDLKMTSGSWEAYLNDPGTTPREQLRTEVVYPISR